MVELREALESGGCEVRHIPNHDAPRHFPTTVQEMQQFNVIVLSDISSDTLLLHPDTLYKSLKTPNRLECLAEYVQAGGGFAMIGGWMSFAGRGGQARYHSTGIEEILPVSIAAVDDRVETPQGVIPKVMTKHDIIAGIPEPWPYFVGYNKLTAKKDSTVVLSCNNDPFLTVAQKGKGRAGAFASDCSPHWASREFLGWEHYGPFWNNFVKWLARG